MSPPAYHIRPENQDLIGNEFVSAHCFDSYFPMLDRHSLPRWPKCDGHIDINFGIDRRFKKITWSLKHDYIY